MHLINARLAISNDLERQIEEQRSVSDWEDYFIEDFNFCSTVFGFWVFLWSTCQCVMQRKQLINQRYLMQLTIK